MDKKFTGNSKHISHLKKHIASPGITGVRQVWDTTSIASTLTPTTLASILNDANAGNMQSYLTLAMEMEERDPHFASVIQTRKLAVSGLEPAVKPHGDDKHDSDLAQAVEELINREQFNGLLNDLLDGISKGYSVCEIIWQYGATFTPKKYLWRDPRYFQFADNDNTALRLRDESEPINGIELVPHKFIIHVPSLRTGITARSGIARTVAVAYMCKSFTLTDWMNFVETFGTPIRVGKFGNQATKEDISKLKSAVMSIGQNAGAVMPETMNIDFIEASQSRGGESLFENLAKFLDAQVSKAVLGQTMTTDDGSSQSQANVHNEVRMDILRADARQLASTLNKYLVRPFIDLNYGEQEHYPEIYLPVEDAEDLSQLTDNITKLVPLGLPVSKSQIMKKLGLETPIDESDFLKITTPAHNSHAHNHTHAGINNHPSLNAKSDDPDEYNELEDWQEIIGPMLSPMTELLNECKTLEEFNERLPEVLDMANIEKMTELIALINTKSQISGNKA